MSGSLKTPNRKILLALDFYLDAIDLGVVRFARERRWELLAGMRHTRRFPKDALPLDGIIASVTRPETMESLTACGCPIVRVLTPSGHAAAQLPGVVPDYRGMGETGARHLLDIGLKSLVFYRFGEGRDSARLAEGFEAAAKAAGVQPRLLWLMNEVPTPEGYPRPAREQVLDWLASRLEPLPCPFGIMAEDDRFAQHVLIVCERLGRRVPEDIAVIGSDNTLLGIESAWIPLSSVDAGLCEVGYEAARLLEQRMNGREVPLETIVPSPGLYARKSTSVFYSADPQFETARNYIAAHFREPLRVEQIARHSGLSVTRLQRTMREETGRPVSGEIQRLRLDQAKRLLTETPLKLDTVAAECGFVTGRRLCTVFRQATGTTPNVWRGNQTSPGS